MKNIYDKEIEFAFTCINPEIDLDEFEKKSKKANYRKIVKLIKLQRPDIYNSLCLNLYNPWAKDCKKDDNYLMINHSQIFYFFRILN